MGLLRLSICISGVYATFLLWAIAQERREFTVRAELSAHLLKSWVGAVSKPFPSVHDQAYRPSHSRDPGGDKLPSTLFLNFAQAAASATFAAVYLTIGSWRNGNMRTKGIRGVLGLDLLLGASVKPEQNGKEGHPVSNGTNGKINGAVNGTDHHSGSNGTNHKGISGTRRQDDVPPIASWTKTLPFLLFQVSLFQTMAGPIGFSALRHISYPTMVLGKVSRVALPCACTLFMAGMLIQTVLQAHSRPTTQRPALPPPILASQVPSGLARHRRYFDVHVFWPGKEERRVRQCLGLDAPPDQVRRHNHLPEEIQVCG